MRGRDVTPLIKAVGTVLREAFGPRFERIDKLEARIKELESRPLLKYAGVFQADASYVEGRLVTHKGGLWLATAATTGTPGDGANGWRLIVKSGSA